MKTRLFPTLFSAVLFVFISVFNLSGCSENKPSTKAIPPKVKKNKEVVKPVEIKVIDTLINNENVIEKLLAYGEKNPETIVLITTSMGEIKVRLFKDTPLHRANFIMLAKSGYFNGTVFTRVVKDFMAQCGSPYTYVHVDLQKAIGQYTVPAEMNTKHFHKKGALVAARDYPNNPEKRSDPYVFYMVEGTRFGDETLDYYEEQNGYHYSAAQRKYYLNNQGAAHLDGEHTVFGEIISGYSVVPKLTAVETDRAGWPIDDIFVEKVEVLK